MRVVPQSAQEPLKRPAPSLSRHTPPEGKRTEPMSVIIDRRPNDRDKSAGSRERFMRRYKRHIRRAVADMIDERPIRDVVGGGEVRIPARDLSEPAWRHGQGGARDIVLPGNREFMPGDRLQRPPGGAANDGDGDGDTGEGGDGSDSFAFTLSRDEFLSIFFDDLELPHMMRTGTGGITESTPERAGYASDGAQTNLAVLRTMRQALGRRIALGASARRRLAELEAEEESEDGDSDDAGAAAREAEREALRARIERVPWLDDVDLRFRRRTLVPKPVSQAVMVCLMDVSASMDRHRKDLAKRFYTLLYLFLSRRYERVEIVFVRHTDRAEEVDEERFFNDRQTGGTTVLPALKLASEIIDARFSPSDWNVYVAQASDGDAFGVDPERSRQWLETDLLPKLRHFAYVEVGGPGYRRPSALARAYQRIESEAFAMVKAGRRRDIYPVFRRLFAKRGSAEATA